MPGVSRRSVVLEIGMVNNHHHANPAKRTSAKNVHPTAVKAMRLSLGVPGRFVIGCFVSKCESRIANCLLGHTKKGKGAGVGNVLEADGNLNRASVGSGVGVANLASLDKYQVVVEFVLESHEPGLTTVKWQVVGDRKDNVAVGFAGADEVHDFALFDAH